MQTDRQTDLGLLQSLNELQEVAQRSSDLCESRELVHPEEVSSIQGFKSKFNCRGTVSVPAALLLARPEGGDMILWRERKSATVQKLQQEHEHIVSHNAHRNDGLLGYMNGCCCSCGGGLRDCPCMMMMLMIIIPHLHLLCIATEDHSEKRTASC